MDSSIATRIRETLADLNAESIWVFGSFAEARESETSDVDIAVLLSPGSELPSQFRERLSLVLARDVDLVDLRRASPILQMQVLKHGKLIEERAPQARVRFEAQVPARYEDLKIIRRSSEQAMMKRYRNG